MTGYDAPVGGPSLVGAISAGMTPQEYWAKAITTDVLGKRISFLAKIFPLGAKGCPCREESEQAEQAYEGLCMDVLEAIACGAANAQQLAEIALTAAAHRYPRRVTWSVTA